MEPPSTGKRYRSRQRAYNKQNSSGVTEGGGGKEEDRGCRCGPIHYFDLGTSRGTSGTGDLCAVERSCHSYQ